MTKAQADRMSKSVILPPDELNPCAEPALDFPYRVLHAMSAADYRAIGFLAGLEVHQQLSTAGKLFCRCPAGQRVADWDAEVLRHMRPTLSELGEYDGTALMEFKTRKEIVYLLDRNSVCTYEIDDTPPFEIDSTAVEIAVEIALLANMQVVSELHVMRKQYLDGSIPTGFQRTAMIGMGGSVPLRDPDTGAERELQLRQISLEEDSCRELSDVGHRITFRTDRLGTPLSEIVTEPELVTPREVETAGRLLADIARASGRVRRGAGAGRQDVNVSIAGGRRVELKGVDRHRGLQRLVHIEAFRQLSLLKIRHELHQRGVTASMLTLDNTSLGQAWERSGLIVDASSTVRHSSFAPIADARDAGDLFFAIRLPGFAGILSLTTQPGINFARELADRVRVIACLRSRPFMVHSDLPGLPDYGLEPSQWRALRRRLKADSGDAILVLWGAEEDLGTAIEEILARARESLIGVPAETRQVFSDGSTGFERVLPGPDRMYPDTDTPPIAISDETVTVISSRLAEQPWVRSDRYSSFGIQRACAERLATSAWADLFDTLEPADSEVAQRLAFALEKRIPYHQRHGGLVGLPQASRLRPLVAACAEGVGRTIDCEAFERAFDALIEQPDVPSEVILSRFRHHSTDREELDRLVAETCEAVISGDRRFPGDDAFLHWSLGRVMPGLIGRVSTQTAAIALLAARRDHPSR